MSTSLDDRSVVDFFVGYLRDNGHPGLEIDRRPEDEPSEPYKIDAIAGPFAIEHTSVDTIANQRRDSHWFMQAVGGLEAEVSPEVPYRLRITLPYEGVRRGQDWAEIRNAFKEWIANSSNVLADGQHSIREAPGIPFEFRVNKVTAARHGVIFSRLAPDNSDLPDRVRDQLSKKAEKLAPYKGDGYTTVLLVESEDIALMNESKMLEAIWTASSGSLPAGVDQVWFADTSIPSELLFHDLTREIQDYSP